MENKCINIIEISQLKADQEKNNRILSACLKKAALPQNEIDRILNINNLQQTWKLLAEYAGNFDLFSFEKKKDLVNSFFSSAFYGETVSSTYDCFSKASESCDKELFRIYAYVCVVAEFASAGFPQRLSAIAEALCKVLDENEVCNENRELTVLLSSEERQEGRYAYNLDNYSLGYLGK